MVSDVLLQMKSLNYDTLNSDWVSLSKNAQNFVERLLVELQQRATIEQCFAHTWLQDVI